MYRGYCVVCHQAISKEIDVCPACGNKTFTPEHRTAPHLIADRARYMTTQLNYSLEEALGDVIGGLLYEVDATLHHEGSPVSSSKKSEFYTNLMFHINNWFDKE